MREFGILPIMTAAALGTCAQALAGTSFDDVAPIFEKRCVVCHSGDGAPLGLRLDNYNNILQGGQRGPVVKAGDPNGSELLRRIRGESQPRMPLVGEPLPREEMERIARWVAEGLAPGTTQTTQAAVAGARPGPAEPLTYAHVAPILLQRCAKCHSDQGILRAPPEGYRLGTYDGTLAAGERARIVPGQPGASELVRRIRGQSRPRMPFDGPPWLPEEDIRLIEEWIRQGARSASGEPAPVPVGARVRFEGTLTSRWAVDFTPILVDARTRVRKAPRVGDRVEVRGTVQEDGSILAVRVRRR